jgi:hypothetical protein
MISLLKVAAVLVIASVAMMATGAIAAGAYLYSGGVASVQVDTPDVDLSLPVPLRLVDLGLGIAESASPSSSEDFASRLELPRSLFAQTEVEEWRPLLRRLADEMGSMPEGELVRVTTGREEVVISQRGGRFRVDVDAPDAQVHVSLPRRAAARILDKVADL